MLQVAQSSCAIVGLQRLLFHWRANIDKFGSDGKMTGFSLESLPCCCPRLNVLHLEELPPAERQIFVGIAASHGMLHVSCEGKAPLRQLEPHMCNAMQHGAHSHGYRARLVAQCALPQCYSLLPQDPASFQPMERNLAADMPSSVAAVLLPNLADAAAAG
jgi:hypothetical protein